MRFCISGISARARIIIASLGKIEQKRDNNNQNAKTSARAS